MKREHRKHTASLTRPELGLRLDLFPQESAEPNSFSFSVYIAVVIGVRSSRRIEVCYLLLGSSQPEDKSEVLLIFVFPALPGNVVNKSQTVKAGRFQSLQFKCDSPNSLGALDLRVRLLGLFLNFPISQLCDCGLVTYPLWTSGCLKEGESWGNELRSPMHEIILSVCLMVIHN